MLFSKEIIGNSQVAKAQYADVQRERTMAAKQEKVIANMSRGLVANEGLIPQDVYVEFDNVTVEEFRSDEGDTYLNDLLPLSRSVGIGSLIHKFRQSSDAGYAQTSLTGQIGVKMDKVQYAYDGSIVPIHDAGYERNWREYAAMTAEGFDALIDDQRETVRTLRNHLADSLLTGFVDADGQYIVQDGISWQGMKNDSRVNAIDIGTAGINFDFTSNANSGEAIKAAFLQIRDVLWISNNVGQDVTYYISREIASNFERKFSNQYDSRTIIQELGNLMGVATIKVSSKLVGNEIMGFPLSGSVRPVVGMALNTVQNPRNLYNDNYRFITWGAIGFEVRPDFKGQSGAFFAQELT